VREKDGLWAVLLWLNIRPCATIQADIVADHWNTFSGRDYYSRYDFRSGSGNRKANKMMQDLRGHFGGLVGNFHV
jgi:phosphoglucomutase